MAPQRTAGAEQHTAAASSSDGPAARSQAAVSQQQRAAADLAWPLLLQHDSIRTQLPVARKLLCCSKALAAAVAEHSAGQLDMPPFFTDAQVDRAGPWLRKHARLVRSLDLSACTEACAAALVAAGPLPSLALQSLAVDATDTNLSLLEQLPASHLTRLNWRVSNAAVQPQDRPAFVARLSAALGRLTALRSLELDRRWDREAAAPALPGLSALTQLTALSFCGPLSGLQQHVPSQLLELRLDTFAGQQPLDLRHLAATTALTIVFVPVTEGDVLPPNLLQLRVTNCRSVQPLLPLVHLQQLVLALPDEQDIITADQLRQLSGLTALRLHRRNHYGHNEPQMTEPASAAAWPALPLRQLELERCILSVPVCQHLAQLTGLTSLRLRSCKAGSGQQLLAALTPLVDALMQLSEPVLAAAVTAAAQQEEDAAGVLQLLQAVGGLQQLRELELAASRLPWSDTVVEASATSSCLAALTALTGLTLFDCGVTDAAVAAIVPQLPGLQSLDCSWNVGVTDAALPAIGGLQQLTKLVMDGFDSDAEFV